jgi:uncharacterized UBP type Zn finger protein
VTDEVSHPCKARYRIIVQCILIFIFWKINEKTKLPITKFHKPAQEFSSFFHKDQPKSNNLLKDDNGDLFPSTHNILNYLQVAFCQYHISHLVATYQNATSMRWIHLTFSFAVFTRAYKLEVTQKVTNSTTGI